MLRNLSELRRYVIEARDGEIGRCHDFLFDDRYWAIRYMVADTRKWLPGLKVLISPISLELPDWQGKRFPVKLTREQVKGNPPWKRISPYPGNMKAVFSTTTIGLTTGSDLIPGALMWRLWSCMPRSWSRRPATR